MEDEAKKVIDEPVTATPALDETKPAEPTQSKETTKAGAYSKTNWLKWIVIYAIIAVFVYGLIYYFVLANGTGGSGY